MRVMYDSTTASDIPFNVTAVAGYVDGLYKWSDTDWQRFAHALKVRIAVFQTTNDGIVLDVENGNATPAQSVDWVLMRRKAGVDPTVYTALSNWVNVRNAFRSRNVREPHYWIADWNNTPVIPAGAIACQYADSVIIGSHYDLSIIADYWPGVDSPTRPKKGKLMYGVFEIDKATMPKEAPALSWPGYVTFDGSRVQHIVDGESLSGLLKASGQAAAEPISYAQYEHWTSY